MNPLFILAVIMGVFALVVLCVILVRVSRTRNAKYLESVRLAMAVRLIESEGGVSFLKTEHIQRISAHEVRVHSQLVGREIESVVFPDGVKNISVSVLRNVCSELCCVALSVTIGDGMPRFTTDIDMFLAEAAPRTGLRPQKEDFATAKNESALWARALSLLYSVDSLLHKHAKQYEKF